MQDFLLDFLLDIAKSCCNIKVDSLDWSVGVDGRQHLRNPANPFSWWAMGYIRSNEDYYQSLGYSPKEAKIQAELDKRKIDYGYCNPIKAKLAAEEEEEVRRNVERGSD